jgi:hypothetical protein
MFQELTQHMWLPSTALDSVGFRCFCHTELCDKNFCVTETSVEQHQFGIYQQTEAQLTLATTYFQSCCDSRIFYSHKYRMSPWKVIDFTKERIWDVQAFTAVCTEVADRLNQFSTGQTGSVT